MRRRSDPPAEGMTWEDRVLLQREDGRWTETEWETVAEAHAEWPHLTYRDGGRWVGPWELKPDDIDPAELPDTTTGRRTKP